MSEKEDKTKPLRFTPFISYTDPTFWHRLCEVKLNCDKLKENAHAIWGYYSNQRQGGLNTVFSVDAASFNEVSDESRLAGYGRILNKNTIEAYKEEDKMVILREEGMEFMDILKYSAVEKPVLLNKFLILSFADLKSFRFVYKFLFLAPTFLSYSTTEKPKLLYKQFDESQIEQICNGYMKLDQYNRNFFLIKVNGSDLSVVAVKHGLNEINNNENWIFGFADSCGLENPGWPLRNYLAFISYHCGEIIDLPIKVLCLRLNLINGKWQAGNSLLLSVKVNKNENTWQRGNASEDWVGWERDENGLIASKTANLQNVLDPMKLAESSVNLNLKLMKWQIVPDLNLDVVRGTKCLLLGAGTLGCSVARNLLSWGVQIITLVDYGNVSYSNPVRQSLFKFEDTGKSKAETAAAALKEIYPNVLSRGIKLHIPMPGYATGPFKEEINDNVEMLESLIMDHDAIFLLLDSRESRWLPTMIAAARGKLVINAALGFDSFLVMRHGMRSVNNTENGDFKSSTGSKLGCYFCNDVTAPGDSSKSRTLDQQCTVTRPGMSSIAGGLAVELLMSILHHPLQGFAPAESDPDATAEGLLGIIPHSVRGFMSHYQIVLPATEAFQSCVACSLKVTNEYQKQGLNFILKAIESKEYLEELCDLQKLLEEPLMSEVVEYSDSGSES